MIRAMLSGIASAVVGLTGLGLAQAADLGGAHQGSVKDDYVAAPQQIWTGLYVGGHAGLATGETTGKLDPQIGGFVLPISIGTEYDMSGAIYGGHLGYNRQIGNVVLGIEGTWSAASINGNTACLVVLNCKREVDSIGTLVGRFGHAMDRTMVYGLAGVAWGDVKTKITDNIVGLLEVKGEETHVGWVVGLGIEHAISKNLFARVEYNHIELGSESHNLGISLAGVAIPGINLRSNVNADIDTLKVGVSYKFN